MGTYDIRGGAPLSPSVEDWDLSELQEKVLELLEEAEISQEINDRIIELVAKGELEKVWKNKAT